MGATVYKFTMNEYESPEAGEVDDRKLVERAVAGDSAAFEDLVRLKSPRVLAHCRRMIADREEARDIAQLVFIRLWEKLDTYDSSFQFDTWLYRVVSNVTIDFVRSRQTRDNAVNSPLRLVRDSSRPSQAVNLQHAEVDSIFAECSKALTPLQKQVFVMREIEQMTSPEVAEILGCRESTVRNHLFNARKTLQKELAAKYPEYAREGGRS